MKSTSDLARHLLGTPAPRKPSGRYVQTLAVPVEIRGRGTPDGVPLEEILAAAKAEASTVEGLTASDGKLSVFHSAEPDAAQRDRLDRLFADRDRLLALARPARRALSGGDLRAALLDEQTPDAEWLRMFRQWAVAELLAGKGEA